MPRPADSQLDEPTNLADARANLTTARRELRDARTSGRRDDAAYWHDEVTTAQADMQRLGRINKD